MIWSGTVLNKSDSVLHRTDVVLHKSDPVLNKPEQVVIQTKSKAIQTKSKQVQTKSKSIKTENAETFASTHKKLINYMIMLKMHVCFFASAEIVAPTKHTLECRYDG